MKKIMLAILMGLTSGIAAAGDFNQDAIATAQRQSKAEVFQIGQTKARLGALYSTSTQKIDWHQGHSTAFIGKRKPHVAVANYIQEITNHVETVAQAFSNKGLRGYFFIVYQDYEIAFQNWESESSMQQAFATAEGRAIAEDAGTFLEPSLFVQTRDFQWLNGVFTVTVDATPLLAAPNEILDCASQGLGADTGSPSIKLKVSRNAKNSFAMLVTYPDLPGSHAFAYTGAGIAIESSIDLTFDPGHWTVKGKPSKGCGLIHDGCYRIEFGYPGNFNELICKVRISG